MSRAQAQRLIDEGMVSQAGRVRHKAGDRLEGHETLTVTLPEPVSATPLPQEMGLHVIFEDASLIVVDKPAGMPVHPGPGHSDGTLVNALLAHCNDLSPIGGVLRPGIVHRLDKDTSGLIIAAKSEKAHLRLAAQIKAHEVKKTYLALVEGKVQPVEAMIDAPIGRDPNNRRRMMIRASGGREAQTSYHVVKQLADYALLEATLITGRTHQIRVHLASLGHPVVGDILYGKASPLASRQLLHAWHLSFAHPISGEPLSLEAPIPADLQAAVDAVSALEFVGIAADSQNNARRRH